MTKYYYTIKNKHGEYYQSYDNRHYFTPEGMVKVNLLFTEFSHAASVCSYGDRVVKVKVIEDMVYSEGQDIEVLADE